MRFGLTPRETEVVYEQKSAGVALRIMAMAVKRGGVTADECIKKFGLPPPTVTTRFSELVRCGCLQQTNQQRQTRQNRSARVYVVPKGAMFSAYLMSARHARKKEWLTYSAFDQEVLSVSYDFMRKWRKATSRQGREKLAITLISTLGDRLATKVDL